MTTKITLDAEDLRTMESGAEIEKSYNGSTVALAILEAAASEPRALVPLRRDLRKAAATLREDEARWLVDYYYQMQNERIRAGNQILSMLKGFREELKVDDPNVYDALPERDKPKSVGQALKEAREDQIEEPHELLVWLHENSGVLERRIKSSLGVYANSKLLGEWVQTILGIGPVIASGLLAHFDVTKSETAGGFWRFAGLDPTSVWNKGEKRPWNAKLKRLCWIAGESFVRVQGYDDDVYGHMYAKRKLIEEARNEAGNFADQAAAILKAKNIDKSTEAYKAYIKGKLPPAQIHARAKRYAVKIFIAHYHHVAYEIEHGRLPPKPYVIEHMGHVNYMGPPNWKDGRISID